MRFEDLWLISNSPLFDDKGYISGERALNYVNRRVKHVWKHESGIYVEWEDETEND